jgi:hypothetical protein
METTITYSDKDKGWTSFHSFIPEWNTSLNNRFFTVKNGQLWLHNDNDNPVRNNFYHVQYSSKIVTVINDSNSDDKIFKTIVLEGNKPWDIEIETNLANSTIKTEEFNQRESRFFAHTRKNENENDLHDSAQGIGVINNNVGNVIFFNFIPDLICVGDKLYQLNNNSNEFIGNITDINHEQKQITVDVIVTTPINGFFSFSLKNSRIEGSEIRGYYALISLEYKDTEAVELFAIESNIIKSYV